MDEIEVDGGVEAALPAVVAEAIDEQVAIETAERVAEIADDPHIELERDRIEAEVAKVAIEAEARTEQTRIMADASENEDERWTILETSLLWMMDQLETLEASHLAMHQKFASTEDGRKEKSAEIVEIKEPIVEPPPHEPEEADEAKNQASEPQSTTRRKRFLIR